MSRSTKPYLARALWDWCEDNQLTSLLQVLAEGAGAQVPRAFVKDGQIILNISASATRALSMDNGGITFTARFNGVAEQIVVPWRAVLGLFARETGEGMAFPPEEQEWAADEETPRVKVVDKGKTLSRPQVVMSEAEPMPDKVSDKKKPNLTVIK